MGFFLFFFGFLLGVPIFLEQIFSAGAVGLNDAPSVVVLLAFTFTSITWYIRFSPLESLYPNMN
jgi:hypothetical protein